MDCVREHKAKITGCCCCGFLITAIVLIAISFSTLEATQMGIDYSTVSMSIDTEKLYRPGSMHFLGPGHEFIVFPMNTLEVAFKEGTSFGPLDARTLDGLSVTLQVAFQYRLKDNLLDVLTLYHDWGTDYQTAFAVVARNVLRDVTAKYEAYTLIRDRPAVQAEMRALLGEAVADIHVSLDDLQLTDVQTVGAFEDRLQVHVSLISGEQSKCTQRISFFTLLRFEAAEEMRQAATRAEEEIKVAIVLANNRRNRVNVEAQALLNEKLASANVIRNTIKQTIFEFTKEIDAEIASYSMFAQQSGIPPNGMLEYIWLQNYGRGKTTVKAKLPKPLSLTCAASPEADPCPALVAPLTETNCTVSQECNIELQGSKLSTRDAITLVSVDQSCPGPVQSFSHIAPLDGSLTTKKIFTIPAEYITLPVNTEGLAAGCRDSVGDYVFDAGIVTFVKT